MKLDWIDVQNISIKDNDVDEFVYPMVGNVESFIKERIQDFLAQILNLKFWMTENQITCIREILDEDYANLCIEVPKWIWLIPDIESRILSVLTTFVSKDYKIGYERLN